MLRENIVVSGSLTTGGLIGQLVVPAGLKSSRPATPDTGSLYLEQSYEGLSIARSWVDYAGNSANYTVLNPSAILIKNTTTGWIGYFPATVTQTGNHTVSFIYKTLTGTASLVVDNDGVNDNSFNTTLSVTTTPQVYTTTVSLNSTGEINFYLRYNGGGSDIAVVDFKFAPSGNMTTKSVFMVYNGVNNIDGGWEPIGDQDDSRIAFKYRQIITTSYTAGGYKDSSPWKTVQRTINATDQTISVGDLMDYPSSYSSGGCSKTKLFMWSVNTDNLWKSATTVDGTYTTGIDMVNETAYAHQSKWDLANARDQPGTLFQEHLFAWIFGGSVAAVEKFNFTNETMYLNLYNAYSSTNAMNSSITSSLGATGFSDENYGYGYGSESGMKLFFATDTMNVKQQWGASGQQKGISSKVGKGYSGNEGTYNGGYNLRRWDYATESMIGTVAKPHPNCGEENYTMGQDHQYMIGNYDGTGQNNVSWKFYYSTDNGTTSVSGLAPTTHGGMSSGHCGWRA